MNTIINRKNLILSGFLVIIVLAALLRIYKLDQVPPSLSWDEAANGYNAYTIANWGKDEWGRSFPVYFKSFEDDKNPVHIYLTSISVKFLGLSEFSTRLPAAVVGILSVIVIFFLARILLKSDLAGLVASLVFALSPYTLQFSRFNHEAIFAIFFFMLGLLLFLLSVAKKPWLLPLAFLSWGVSILSYHSAKIVVPLMAALLCILYLKQIWKIKKNLVISGVVLLGILILFLTNPSLLGTARMEQSSIPKEVVQETQLFKKTNNEIFGRTELAWQRYQTYFTVKFLFQTGDEIARHSSRAVGEFYKIDALFLIIGFLFLIAKHNKASVIILSWALLAPIPASIAGGLTETAHAGRSLFMMGSWHLMIAGGVYTLIKLLKKRFVQVMVVVVILVFLGIEVKNYLNYYYGEYTKRYAIEWQYGMKQVSLFVKELPVYFQVYMTDARSQPYIFFLYYLKTPLPEFLSTVKYNTSNQRPSNLVSSYGDYSRLHFGGWDQLQSYPDPYVLYIVEPSKYDGLWHKSAFNVKEVIKYPNGNDAFFIISIN